MVTVTSDKQPSVSFIASREVLDHQSNWASRMSHSEDAEQTGNDVESDVATDDQQGGSYSEVVGRRKRRKKTQNRMQRIQFQSRSLQDGLSWKDAAVN